jgi:hypothetical protein
MIEPLGPDSLNPFDPDSFVISAEVHIIDIEPRISRTLELPVKLNFAQLHEVLQAPERFDLEATNKAIGRAMRAAKGGYRFRRDRS